MGLLDKILGKEKDHPVLDLSNPLALRINNFRSDLEHLARDIEDPLEVVPSDETAYVFIGKPPKKFGIAWINNGKVHNLKTLAQESNVPEMKLQLMSEKLRSAYEKSTDAERFSTIIADQKIVVTDSETLKSELREIIKQ